MDDIKLTPNEKKEIRNTIFAIIAILIILITLKAAAGLKTHKLYDFDCLCRDENASPSMRYEGLFTFMNSSKHTLVNNQLGTNKSSTFLGLWNYSYAFDTGGVWSVFCNCTREEGGINYSRVTHIYEVNVYDPDLIIDIRSPTSNGTTNVDYAYFWVRLNIVGNVILQFNGINYTMVNSTYKYGQADIDFELNISHLTNANYSYAFFGNDSNNRPYRTVNNWIIINNQTPTSGVTTSYTTPTGGGISYNNQENTPQDEFSNCDLDVNETAITIKKFESKPITITNLKQWTVDLEAQTFPTENVEDGCGQIVMNYTKLLNGLMSEEIYVKNNGETTTNSYCNIKFIVDETCQDNSIINIQLQNSEGGKSLSFFNYNFNPTKKFDIGGRQYSFILAMIVIGILSIIIGFVNKKSVYAKIFITLLLFIATTWIMWYLLNKYT